MAKAANKTQPTEASVAAFLAAVEDAARRADCESVAAMMRQATGLAPKMWGPAIVGFGAYHYRYDSGREGDAPVMGFSPRKAALTLYLHCPEAQQPALGARVRFGKGCIYLKRLADADPVVLRDLMAASAARHRA